MPCVDSKEQFAGPGDPIRITPEPGAPHACGVFRLWHDQAWPYIMKLIGLTLWVSTAAAAISNVSVRGVTNTQAVISYIAPNSSACSLEVSESESYSPLVPDVDPALFQDVDDSRASSVNSGASRKVVIGKRSVELALDGATYYSRALQAFTNHYFRITCGDDQATGVFKTANIPFGMTRQDPPQLDPANPGAMVTPTLTSSRSQTVVDPLTGALIRRVTMPADTGWPGTAQRSGSFLYFSGAPRVVGATTVGPDDGYLACFPQGDGGPSTLYYIIPSTGEARFLGWSLALTIINPSDSKFYKLSGADLVQLTYTGSYTAAAPETTLPLSSRTVLAGLESAIQDFDNAFSPADFQCATNVAIGDYIHINCQRAGQDSYGWVAVVRISTGSVVAATRVDANIQCRWCGVHQTVAMYDQPVVQIITHSFGGGSRGHGPYTTRYTGGEPLSSGENTISVSGEPACDACGPDSQVALAQVGDCFTIDSENVCITAKIDSGQWQISRGQHGTKAASHAPGATVNAWCSFAGIMWKFLADPHGTDSTNTNFVNDVGWGNGHSDATTGQVLSESGIGWKVRAGDLVAQIGHPATADISAGPNFAGAAANCFGDSCKKHPSVGAPGSGWITDFHSWDWVGGMNLTPVSGQLYKAASFGTPLKPRYFAIVGAVDSTYSGAPHSLLDVSGPGVILGADSSDSYKYCLANTVGECRSGSAKGDVYLNLPGSPKLTCNGGQSPCLANFAAYAGIVQIGVSGTQSRVISHGLTGLRDTNDYPTAKALADGSWLLFAHAAPDNKPPSVVLMAKLPPFAATDTVDRSKFIPIGIPLTVPDGVHVDTAVIKFGYLEYGTQAQYRCTSRAETCVANGSSAPPTDGTNDPFQFETTDTWSGVPCASGCTIVLPVLPGHLVYYQAEFLSGRTVVAAGAPGLAGDFMQAEPGRVIRRR